MNIAAIGNQVAPLIAPITRGAGAGAAPVAEGQDFGKVIGDAIQHLDQLQQQADVASAEVASGQSADLSGALLKVEEASLALQLSLQVRNKLVESFQEIMRMPV